jgi:hypothetical protein
LPKKSSLYATATANFGTDHTDNTHDAATNVPPPPPPTSIFFTFILISFNTCTAHIKRPVGEIYRIHRKPFRTREINGDDRDDNGGEFQFRIRYRLYDIQLPRYIFVFLGTRVIVIHVGYILLYYILSRIYIPTPVPGNK